MTLFDQAECLTDKLCIRSLPLKRHLSLPRILHTYTLAAAAAPELWEKKKKKLFFAA